MSERGSGFDGKIPPIDVTFTVKSEEVTPITGNEKVEYTVTESKNIEEVGVSEKTVMFDQNNIINNDNNQENFESGKGNENFSGGGSGGSEKNPNPENDPKNKVERIKNVLVNSQFLKPDEKQQQEMPEKLREIDKILGHEFKGVPKIDETIREFSEYGEKGSVTEAQFKIAIEDKELLGEAADLAARELESKDSSLRSDLFMGSRHIDNGLDQKLKGLGREISKHYISNEKIDGQLNILEMTRQRTDFNNPDSIETLFQKIEKTKDKLIDLDLEDEGSVTEQDESITVLNAEKKNLKGIVNESDKKSSDIRREETVKTSEGQPKETGHEKKNKYVDIRSEFKDVRFDNPEEVLAYARNVLNVVENSDYLSTDIALSRVTDNLFLVVLPELIKRSTEEGESAEELLYKDVLLEIKSRLSLHDSAGYMESSGFKISEHGGIMGAVEKIKGNGRVLDEERLKFLIKDSSDKKFNLPISAAWDYIQEANFNYENLLKKVAESMNNSQGWETDPGFVSVDYSKGTTIENQKNGHFFDSNLKRKADVDAYIIKKIKEERGGDAAKAYQLALKLVSASGERSLFNFGLFKGDDFAEDIHFAYFRADDARKGKNIGAMSNRSVQTLTSGWLRTMSDRDDLGVLKAEDIFYWKNNEKLDFDYYFSQLLQGKIHPVRTVFLDNGPTPKMLESGVAYFNKFVDCFNKADPPLDLVNIPGRGYVPIEYKYVDKSDGTKKKVYFINGGREIKKSGDHFEVILNNGTHLTSQKSREGKNSLRSMYALGLLELIGTKPVLGWDIKKIMELKKVMVETNLSSTAKPFLNEGMWDWINEQAIAHDEKKNYNFQQLVSYNRKATGRMAFLDGFFKGIAGTK